MLDYEQMTKDTLQKIYDDYTIKIEAANEAGDRRTAKELEGERDSIMGSLQGRYSADSDYVTLPLEVQLEYDKPSMTMFGKMKAADIKQKIAEEARKKSFAESGLYNLDPNGLYHWQNLGGKEAIEAAEKLGFDIKNNLKDKQDFINFLRDDTNTIKRAEIAKAANYGEPGEGFLSRLSVPAAALAMPTLYDEGMKQIATGEGDPKNLTSAAATDMAADVLIAGLPGLRTGRLKNPLLGGKEFWSGVPKVRDVPVLGNVAQQAGVELARQGVQGAADLGDEEFNIGPVAAVAGASATIPGLFTMANPVISKTGDRGKYLASGIEESILGNPMSHGRERIKNFLKHSNDLLEKSWKNNPTRVKTGKGQWADNGLKNFAGNDFEPGIVMQPDFESRGVKQFVANREKALKRIEQLKREISELKKKERKSQYAAENSDGLYKQMVNEQRVKSARNEIDDKERDLLHTDAKMYGYDQPINVEPERTTNFEISGLNTDKFGEALDKAMERTGVGTAYTKKSQTGMQPEEIMAERKVWNDYAKHLTAGSGKEKGLELLKKIGEEAQDVLNMNYKEMTKEQKEVLDNLVDIASQHPNTLDTRRATLGVGGLKGPMGNKTIELENDVANSLDNIASRPEIRDTWPDADDVKGLKNKYKKIGNTIGETLQDVGSRLEPALTGRNIAQLVSDGFQVPPYQDSAWYKKLNSRQRALVDNLFKAKED